MRTQEQIDKEYSDLCAQLGDIEIRKGTLEFKKNEIIKKIAQLAKEKTQNMETEQ